MRPNIKAHRKRKPWKAGGGMNHPRGGAAFHFKGGRKSPRATANFLGSSLLPQSMKNTGSMIGEILSKMGFKIQGNR